MGLGACIKGWTAAAMLCLAPGLLAFGVGAHSAFNVDMTFMVVLGIVQEGSDPILQYVPGGHSHGRDDGKPFELHHPGTGFPTVVWAYGTPGGDRDIVVADWNGTSWSKLVFLTSSAVSEEDPKAFFDDNGDLWVSWWADIGAGQLWVAHRRANGAWEPNVLVGSGQRPSILAIDGELAVAFERPGAFGQDILLMTESDGQLFTQTLVETDYASPLHPTLHYENGQVWMDWRHSDTLFAFGEFVDGVWTGTEGSLSWNDFTWQGLQEAHEVVEFHILGN